MKFWNFYRQVKEAEDAKRKAEEEEIRKKEDEKRKEREERLRKREKERGDGFPDDDEIKEEELEVKEEVIPMETSEEVITTEIASETEVKDEIKEEPNESKPSKVCIVIIKNVLLYNWKISYF